jgi:hypothetical protein
MNFFKIAITFIFLLIIFSCKKEDLNWDIKRNNSFDVNYSKPCILNNCETLNNITTFVDKISPSSNARWEIGNGYINNGFELNGSSYGGYIEFTKNITSPSKMTFWTRSLNLGYSNQVPKVLIDGVEQDVKIIAGSTDFSDWMQIETKTITPGNHSIKIEYSEISSYFNYFIDEIEFWCK